MITDDRRRLTATSRRTPPTLAPDPQNDTLSQSVSIADWCKNTFEVVRQLRIYGAPVTQIEHKTLGLNPRRAIEQIVEDKNDPGNGYSRMLLCFVQLFIVSNSDSSSATANISHTTGSGYYQLVTRSGSSIDLAGATRSGIVRFNPSMSNHFFIIDNQSTNAITGPFAGGIAVAVGNYTFSVSYTGDFGTNDPVNGKDIVLDNATAVPEPMSAFLIAAAGLGAFRHHLINETVITEYIWLIRKVFGHNSTFSVITVRAHQ